MIISLHTPKAGGSSFRELLKKYYGKSFKEDYVDFPINKSFEKRTKDAINFDKNFNLIKRICYKIKGVKCIHGHFLPYKYKKLLNDKNSCFITWLREPTERLISHYYYWQRTYDIDSQPLHKRVVEESWSLDKFCLSPEMRNLYGKFLWKFPIKNFSFIGITEHFDNDVSFFINNYLQDFILGDIPKTNTNPNNNGLYSEKISKELLNSIKSFHSEDYEIYKYALNERKKRIKSMPNNVHK